MNVTLDNHSVLIRVKQCVIGVTYLVNDKPHTLITGNMDDLKNIIESAIEEQQAAAMEAMQ